MCELKNLEESYLNIIEKDHVPAPGLYPVDISEQTLESTGEVDEDTFIGRYHAAIAQHALAFWNQYFLNRDETYREAFLEEAHRLVEHEVSIGDDAAGWPISFPHPYVHTKSSWLSASTQGMGISVLVRAYALTGKKEFLEAARRAVRTFERDILDGGVSAPIGEDGIFFEDVAVYPAPHILSGFIVALFGLYDYRVTTGDRNIQGIIDRSLFTMQKLLGEFDTGYWVYSDLLSRKLASPSHLVLLSDLLEALARYSDCEKFSAVASRWKSYQQRNWNRLRYSLTTGWTAFRDVLLERVRKVFFPRPQESLLKSVCVALPGFPGTGGITTFVEGIAQVTRDEWQLEYLTQNVGPNPKGFIIHRFGTSRMAPTQFPSVWFYVLTGWWKLIGLISKRGGYDVILPQDGTFTAVFAALAAKLAGARVVCIDHAELTLRRNPLYRAQRRDGYARRPLPVRLLGYLRLALFWPSLSLLARISARLVDHFLIPGVEGDEEEENCRWYGIPASRITRLASMIDIERHFLFDTEERAKAREGSDIPAEAIVVAIICRLSPEKGLDIALESINRAMSALSAGQVRRMRVIIAGDGPLRQHLEESVRQHGLEQICSFWGDIPHETVLSLLAMSDIFLYTSTRGACIPMAVLEAMASGCAVIASEKPLSNAVLLADGRGIAVEPGNIELTSKALVQLLNDPNLCHRMGVLARNYIAVRHSPAYFKRNLMRATGWAALDDLLVDEKNLLKRTFSKEEKLQHAKGKFLPLSCKHRKKDLQEVSL
jgi:glycosyltransferase involved in cell wall biosynthesis